MRPTSPGTSGAVLEIGLESQAGLRTDNQDRIGHGETPFGHVFFVADGLGGHADGAAAAALVQTSLSEIMQRLPLELPSRAALSETIAELNDRMTASNSDTACPTRTMGSTLAMLLVTETTGGMLAIGAHVGDSRIYFMRGPRLFLLTRDHTVVQSLVDSGILSPAAAREHPQAGVLTRALGQSPTVQPDFTAWTQLEPDDRLLLCSDGVSAHLADAAIQEIVASDAAPGRQARELVQAALAAGSADNVSAVVIRVSAAKTGSATASDDEGGRRSFVGLRGDGDERPER